jgi:hypothetical protein
LLKEYYIAFEFLRQQQLLVYSLVNYPLVAYYMGSHPLTLNHLLDRVVLHRLFYNVDAVTTHEVDSLTNVVPVREAAVVGLNRNWGTLAKVNT